MDDITRNQIIAITAGLAVGIVAGRRFRAIRYSIIAFVLIPQAAVMGYHGKWETVSLAIVISIIAVMVDSLVSVRKKQKMRRNHR